MGDSLPLTLTLPELKYPIGSETKEKKVSRNQHSTSMYISIVESILTADEIERVRGFLEPVMRLSGRSEMKLSGKTVYGILTRSIVTVKKNEAWFHFAGQPMKFSIREFHMVTGLKCNGEVERPRGEYEWDLLKGRTHKLIDVLNQLKKTRVDASDERVCLAMLLLVESILLPKNNKGTFPLEYVNKAKDMMYPWGRDAYLVLLRKCFSQDATEPSTVIIETQVCTPVLTQQVGTEATNERHVSPIAPQSIETPFFTPIQTQQVHAQKKSWTFTLIFGSFCIIEETHHLQTSASSPLSTLFENGADVEIATSVDATCRIWYPGNVFAINLCDGVEKVAVTLFADQKRVTVTADKIRPKPPADDREKKFEMMDNVEAFYSKGWSSGQVRMILGENTFSVYLNSSMETLEFKASDLRIHREWLDGVNDIYSVRLNSSTEFIKFNLSDLHIPKEWVDGVWKMEKEPVVGMKRKATAHPVDHAKKGKPVVGMKRKATAQPVYRLAFLQREKKRPIVPRNPPMPVTPEHVDAAFAMLNQKRIEQSSWFNEQGIPKACFVPVQFLETVGYCYENLQKPDKKGINILKGWVGEVVRGLIRPNKMWMQDVDIVYGDVHERLVDHFIGVEIHLMENTITIFHCGVHKVKENPLIQKLAVLIHAIKLEMMNEEISFNDIVPFQVKKAEGLPKTKLPFNCGLFIVKMLECRSLGLKKMSSINDDTAMDLRSKLCCEMFDQFMDKDFQEGCRR
ncbi:unnamed protein product [Brassica oleracea var. botrytis]